MHKMIVMAKAAEGRREDLARWYDERHLPDLLAVPGIVSVERHEVVSVKQPDSTPGWDFALIYEFAGDPMATLRTMPAMGSDAMPASDALDSTQTLSVLALSQGRRIE